MILIMGFWTVLIGYFIIAIYLAYKVRNKINELEEEM